MDIPIISADSHIDIGWLPADTFTSRVPSEWRDRAPRIVEGDKGPQWVADGTLLSGVAAVGSRGRPYSRGRWQRADAMADTALFTDGRNRPANPAARLEDQDRDGVTAEVLYGLFGLTAELADKELAAVVHMAFNDWLAEFCGTHPDRYIGLALLPTHDAGAAAKEIVRATAMGLKGAVLDVKNSFAPVYSDAWDEVWATAQDLDCSIALHTGRRHADASKAVVAQLEAPTGESVIEAAVTMSLMQFTGSADYFGIVFGGALDRYPEVKIVLGESGIGWIPSLLERMDWQYDNEFRHLGLKLKPSDYWHRQMYATFQCDSVGMHLLDFLGEDNVMYASDYPHPDGTWPDTRTFVDKQMGLLSEATKRKILHDNAARLYHLS
jgi:predicted TIM-barrel fold metal-dependent hydrolase